MRWFCLSLFLLTGCASSRELERQDQCAKMRWHQEGQRQALEGQDKVSAALAVCQEIKADVDLEAYMDGYQRGLERACSRDYGYYSGVVGRPYKGNCPRSMEMEFMRGYELGRAEAKRSAVSDSRLVEMIEHEVESIETNVGGVLSL